MNEILEEIIAGTVQIDVNSGKWVAVYDKKLLWRANLYIDEKYNWQDQDIIPEAVDWNNVNPWNDPTNNEWQTYINYADPLIPGEQVNSLGQQIPILPWTHPDTQFLVDAVTYQTYTDTVYSSVAYSWDSGDNFPLFNEKMSLQAQASQDHPGTNIEEPSLAPDGIWFYYDQTSYLPALGIYNHVDKIEDPDIEALDAGLNCTHFMLIAKNYNNNPYSEGTWIIGIDYNYVYNDKNKIIHGDINLLVPGDLIHLSGHWAIVQKIEYIDNSRETHPYLITCIHSTTWYDYWIVQNQQTLWDFFSGWDKFILERPIVE